MIDEEKKLRELAAQLIGYKDTITVPNKDGFLRDIIVSPYNGAYGLAGYVVAIDGTPPRGTFMTIEAQQCTYIGAGRPKLLSQQKSAVVLDYLKAMGFPRSGLNS